MTIEEQAAVFTRWVTSHGALLEKIVRAFARAAVDRDDLRQEIALQLWRSLPRFQHAAKESTWIYRVAFNTALAWGRGEQRRRRRTPAAGTLDETPAAPPSETERRTERLYDLLRALPPAEASLVVMHLEGLSYREISEVLGLSETHVGVKLTRLRQRLARDWREQDDEL
jgi:RNA polymerase sigma-70 factor (ECF subfamily)